MTENTDYAEPDGDSGQAASDEQVGEPAQGAGDAADAPSDDPFGGDGEPVPVTEVAPAAPARPPVHSRETGDDWTRADPIRDDPGTFGEEARRLWETLRGQLVDPLLRNYPEAAGHLTTAGSEFAAALRALVRGPEQDPGSDTGEQGTEGTGENGVPGGGEDRRDG